MHITELFYKMNGLFYKLNYIIFVSIHGKKVCVSVAQSS